MNRTPLSRIDKLLSQIGIRPDDGDPDGYAAGSDPVDPPAHIRQTGPCGKCCYSSEANARKAGNRVKSYGANTSFFRPYPDLADWRGQWVWKP